MLCRFEHSGENIKTYTKYLHIIRMWTAFCLEVTAFSHRWDFSELDALLWMDVAEFFFSYSGWQVDLTARTLESYMTMLAHVFIMMSDFGARKRDDLHDSQRSRIQKVVTDFCQLRPECRCVANTKSAWDDVLVDAQLLQMQLLLLCNVQSSSPAAATARCRALHVAFHRVGRCRETDWVTHQATQSLGDCVAGKL